MICVTQSQRGFTLIETLIALFLLAVISVLSYQGVALILDTNERSQQGFTEEAKLQRAWQMIGRDLIHLRPRTFGDGLGGQELAYMTNKSDAGVRFSRGGGPMVRSNPSGIRRIEYSLNDSRQLLRKSWAISASPRYSDGHHLVLLNNVSNIIFEQFDVSTNDYTLNWPPLRAGSNSGSLPKMIRVTIELENGTKTSRLFFGVES